MSIVGLAECGPRKVEALVVSRRRAVGGQVRSGQVGSAQRSHEWVLTYSTTEGSAGDGEVLELEVGIKDVAVQLSLAIEPVANALPPEGCLFLDFTHHAAMSDMLRRVMLSVARGDGD